MKGWSLALIVMVGACTPVAVLPPGTSTPVPESAPVAAQPPAQKLVLKKTSFNKITGWSGDRHDQVIGTLLRSCAKFAKMPADLSLGSIGGVWVCSVSKARNGHE